jgi:hypothetical protein
LCKEALLNQRFVNNIAHHSQPDDLRPWVELASELPDREWHSRASRCS